MSVPEALTTVPDGRAVELLPALQARSIVEARLEDDVVLITLLSLPNF